MRHLGSVLLTLVIGPLVLALIGRGLDAFLDATAESPAADPLAVVTALASLGLAGMLFALLILPRFSPLGPLLAAAGYLTLGAVMLLEPDRVAAAQPWVQLGVDPAAATVTGALALVLAMPLLLSAFSAQRWTGPQPAVAPVRSAPGGYPPPPPTHAAPSYPAPGPPPGYSQATYVPPAYPPPTTPPAYRQGPDPTLEMSLGRERAQYAEPNTEQIETVRQSPPAGPDEQPTQVTDDAPTQVPGAEDPTHASPAAEATAEATEAPNDEPPDTPPAEAEATESPTEKSPN